MRYLNWNSVICENSGRNCVQRRPLALATLSQINTARCGGFRLKTCFEIGMKQQSIKRMLEKTVNKRAIGLKTKHITLDGSQTYRINPQYKSIYLYILYIICTYYMYIKYVYPPGNYIYNMFPFSRHFSIFPRWDMLVPALPSSKPSWQGHIEMIGLFAKMVQTQLRWSNM